MVPALRGTRRLLGASAICVAALIPAAAPAAAGGAANAIAQRSFAT